MKRWMHWLISPTVLGSLGLLVFSALVWWVGPLVAIGSWRPLDAVWVRLLVIALAWALWIGQRVWRRVRQNRANQALLQGISGSSSVIDRESEVLQQRFGEAIVKLKAAGKGKGASDKAR